MLRYAISLGILVFATSLLLPVTLEAGYIGVANPSFETPGLGDPGNSTTSMPGWQIDESLNSSAGIWAPTVYAYPYWFTQQGDNVAFINGGAFVQWFGVTVEANTTYTLDVLIGNRADYGIPGNGYRVDFLTYNWETETSYLLTPTSFMRPTPGSGDWAWARTTCSIPAVSVAVGETLGIRLWSYQGWPPAGTAGQTNFDLVTVQATATGSETPIPVVSNPMEPSNPYDPNYNPVYDPEHDDYSQPSIFDPTHPDYDPGNTPPWFIPEPATFVLLSMGALMLLPYRHRKRT